MKNLLSFFLLLILAGCSPKVHPAGQPVAIEDLTTFRTGQPVTQATTGALRYKVSFNGDLTLTPLGVTAPTDTVVVPPGPIDPPIDPPTTVGDAAKIGSKVFQWTGLNRVKDLGMTQVSVYVPLHWIFTEKGFYGEPFFQAWTNEAPGLDTYLAQAKSMGISVHLVANQTPEWLRSTGNGTGGNDYPPAPAGSDLKNPASYAKAAEMYGQLAMRYGSRTHDPALLKVDQTQQWPNQPQNQKKSGLNMGIKLAFGNELDHWFQGFDHEKYMDPAEHAALLVACVKEVRKADPTMEYYIAGLTDLNLRYLKETYQIFGALWPEGKAYFPNIDVHHYSNILNAPGTDKPTWAMSGGCYPEQDAAFSQINQIVAWAKSIGKKCIVSEFGYDKKAPSMMHIKGNGISDSEAQAIGIVKSFRAYLAAGVDAVYVFEFADEPHGDNGGQFANCGLVGKQANGFLPLWPAHTAVKALITELKRPAAGQGLPSYSVRQSAPPGVLQTGQSLTIGDQRQRVKKFAPPAQK